MSSLNLNLVAYLFGCKSCRIIFRLGMKFGHFDLCGVILEYLLQNCQVYGYLWSVLDKDTDKLTVLAIESERVDMETKIQWMNSCALKEWNCRGQVVYGVWVNVTYSELSAVVLLLYGFLFLVGFFYDFVELALLPLGLLVELLLIVE